MKKYTQEDLDKLERAAFNGLYNEFCFKSSDILDPKDTSFILNLLDSAIQEVFLKIGAGEYDSD